jgi:hypothetical protein
MAPEWHKKFYRKESSKKGGAVQRIKPDKMKEIIKKWKSGGGKGGGKYKPPN